MALFFNLLSQRPTLVAPMSNPVDIHAKVFVVDDDPAVRESLVELFASVSLPAEAFGSTAEFLKRKVSDGPSCLVLDVRLPGLSGLDFQSELAKLDAQLPVIFITGHGDIPMSVRAMKAGAIEFLTKPFRDQELLDAVQRGLELDGTRRDQQKSMEGIRNRFTSLTAREQEVIAFVSAGLLNKQIAGRLGVSEITVKVHRGNAMRKMGAKSLAHLLKMAQALKLELPDQST
jgi:FixJ family two-component response regulator